MWKRRLLNDEEKKILKRLREVMLISENSIGITEKSKCKRTERNSSNYDCVIHNVITNPITEMNNLLYTGAYVVVKSLGT